LSSSADTKAPRRTYGAGECISRMMQSRPPIGQRHGSGHPQGCALARGAP